jgi:ribosome-associated protein
MDDVNATGPIPLGAFLKLAGVTGTGGHAKVIIQSGEVKVNGEVETRRGRTLQEGDVVAAGGREFRVCSSPA